MKTIITLALISLSASVFSQDTYFTRNGAITFFSSTPVEDIKAENFSVNAVFDAKTGNLEFSLLMKSFNFKKALMQEHFNENYVESDKFPKCTFKGKIADISSVNLSKDGTYPVKVTGDMTLHGVTKPVSADGTLTVKEGKVLASSAFKIKPEDYNIEIPSVVRDKIAKELEVTVKADLEPFKK
jgi:polyisoprenoid-binding protein YceI